MAKPCELRRERDGQVVCGAGGFVLAEAGGDTSRLEAVCGACTIPDELAGSRWACLHLRPVRLQRDGQWKSYFSCRWFYRLRPDRQPESLRLQCHGCPHWFPRPPVAMMEAHGYWEETEEIREAVRSARPGAPKAPEPAAAAAAGWAAAPPGAASWRHRLRRWLGRWADAP